MRAVLVAAGTGGHVNPAIAIANKIKQEESDADIIFIGTFQGLENDLVPRAGYELEQIEAYGLQSLPTFSNISNFIKTISSISDAQNILKEFKPDIVIGTGGYVCAPVFIAANRLKIPTVLHESNAFPGRVVKLFNKSAKKILLGFDKAKEQFKYKENLVTVGNPTNTKKHEFTKKEKTDIFKNIGFNENLPTILVTGGSQGAKSINLTLVDIIKTTDINNYQIAWATGREQYDEVKELLRESNIDINNIKNVKVFPYIYEMTEMLEITDLMVCRSGAMTVTEIMILGKPAIFIPYPSESANRQVDNASVLEEIGAAKIILNKDLNKEILLKMIDSLIFDKKLLEEMGNKAKSIAETNVIERIYKEIKEVTN